MTMRTCWQLLSSIAQEAAAHGAGQGTAGAAAAMLKGAQRYLEQGHVSHMQRTIQADRAQVRKWLRLHSMHRQCCIWCPALPGFPSHFSAFLGC
jgi:hypothetical protein